MKKERSDFIYIGYTNDLDRRMEEHKLDKPGYKVVYYEAYSSDKDARHREQMLKDYGNSLGHLKKRIKGSLED